MKYSWFTKRKFIGVIKTSEILMALIILSFLDIVLLTVKVVIWVLVAFEESIYKQIVQLMWYVYLSYSPQCTHLTTHVMHKPTDNLHDCSVYLYVSYAVI